MSGTMVRTHDRVKLANILFGIEKAMAEYSCCGDGELRTVAVSVCSEAGDTFPLTLSTSSLRLSKSRSKATYGVCRWVRSGSYRSPFQRLQSLHARRGTTGRATDTPSRV